MNVSNIRMYKVRNTLSCNRQECSQVEEDYDMIVYGINSIKTEISSNEGNAWEHRHL